MSILEDVVRMANLVRYEGPRKTLRVGILRYEWLRERAEPGDYPLWSNAVIGAPLTGVKVVIDTSLPPMGWEVGDE